MTYKTEKISTGLGALIIMPLFFLISACAQYEYSQFRSEEENKERFALLFFEAIQTCDGKIEADHKVCVTEVKKELTDRFNDRNKAFMTKADVIRIIATQIIIEYETGKAAKAEENGSTPKQYDHKALVDVPKKAPELAFKGTEELSSFDVIRTTRSRACIASPFSFSLSLGTVYPIVCN
jgi:hypothetical protein